MLSHRKGVLLDGIGSELVRSSNGGRRKTLSAWLKDLQDSIELGDLAETFTSADATPSVAGGSQWITSGSTTITDFDDATEGQIITIMRGDADITITRDGSKIETLNALDVTLQVTHPTITFRSVAGVWQEIDRHDQVVKAIGGNIRRLASWVTLIDQLGSTPISAPMAAVIQASTLQLGAAALSFTNTARDTNAVTKTLPDWMDFDDTTCVLGNGAKFFYPDSFGSPATGRVARFNRIKVGAATLSSADSAPLTTSDFLETIVPNTSSLGQFVALSALGTLGIVGGARASDFRTWSGSSSGGVQGVSGYGINDDTTGHAIAVGIYGLGVRVSGGLGTTENELTAANGGSVVTITPNSTLGSGGQTIALNLTAGIASYEANISAYLTMGTSITAKGRMGGVTMKDALDTAMGNGGAGIAWGYSSGQSLAWYDTGADTIQGELWGSTDGLVVKGTGLIPSADGGVSLGKSGGAYLNLWLASGGKIDFNAGDVTITHSTTGSGTLTFAGAAGGYQFNGGSVATGGNVRAGNATAITAGGSTTGLTISSTASFGVFCGSGAPSITAAKGSLYLRSDGSGTTNRAYINTDGGTTWTALTTAA